MYICMCVCVYVLRTLRETAALRKWLLRVIVRVSAHFLPRECENSAPKSTAVPTSANTLRVSMQMHPRNRSKSIENPSQISPKIDEKRVRRHPGAAQSTNEATDGRFSRSFCENRPKHYYDFTLFWLKI